jgi:hypothetical protein
VRAPWLVLLVVAIHWGLAGVLALAVESGVAVGLGQYSLVDGQNLFYALIEYLVDHPGVLAAWSQLLAVSALASLLLWTLLSGGVLLRLRRPEPWSYLARDTVRVVPGILVVTAWHFLPRLVLLGLAGAVTGFAMEHPPWGWPAALLTLCLLFYCTCALDLARAAVALAGERPGWRTARRAYGRAWRQRGLLLSSMLLSLGQWLLVLLTVRQAIAGFAMDAGPWPARLLAALGVVLGLWRMSVAVEGIPGRPRG